MATSGTSAFGLDIADIIEEAYDRCGLRSRTGYDLKTARRSLDLLALEWQTRGINFWTLEQVSVSLVAGTASYTLDADTIDVLEVLARKGTGTSQVDYPMNALTMSQYATLTNKNTQGRPSNYWIDKQRDAPVMYLWPVPDSSTTWSAVVWKLRRIEDTGSTPTETDPDVPARFLPALIAGLAHKIAQKQARELVPQLKLEYEEAWMDAVSSDRDRASFRVRPYLSN